MPTQLLAEGVLGLADLASTAPLAVDARGAAVLAATTTLVASGVTVLRRRRRRLRERAMDVPTR
jgi:hypothetical protein